MAQGGLIFALVFGLVAVAFAATGPGSCGSSCTGYCDWSNNCCALPTGCTSANCAAANKCTKTICLTCDKDYSYDTNSKACCSLKGTGLTNVCTAATCAANGTSVKCTACVAGYYVSNGACTACTLSRCTTVASCDATGSNVKCATCTAPAVLSSNSDKRCCNPVDNCASVSSCAVDGTASVCEACNAGYYLASGVCTACPANANCLAGQANLKCSGATTPIVSTCTACPATPAVNSVLSSAGECCQVDTTNNCLKYKTCGPVVAVSPATTPASWTYGTATCDSCQASTAPVTPDLTGVAWFLSSSNTCQQCGDSTMGAGVYEHDFLCGSWGCTSADPATNFCLTCSGVNSAKSYDNKCGVPIAGCNNVTTVEIVSTGTGSTRTIATYSRCAITTGGTTINYCKSGTYFTAGVAYTSTSPAPSSDSCTVCPVPSAQPNCAAGSCTGANTGFGCTACKTGYYLSGVSGSAAATCVAYTASCAAGTTLTAAGTATSDITCTLCKSCGTGQFIAQNCTATVDTICAPCKVTCDNCAASTCLEGCTTCANNYVFTSPSTECEVACGNGKVDNNEQCDESSSGHCNNCECDAGFYPNSDGVCADIDECKVYTCDFNSADNVECTMPEANTRVCTCLHEKTVRGSADSSQTLTGSEYFNGCNDADLSEEDWVRAILANHTPLDWFLEQRGASASNYALTEGDDRSFGFTVVFEGDAESIDSLTTAIKKDFLFNLFGIAIDNVDVVITAPSAKRATTYNVVVTLHDNATNSAAIFAPFLCIVAVLLMLIR